MAWRPLCPLPLLWSALCEVADATSELTVLPSPRCLRLCDTEPAQRQKSKPSLFLQWLPLGGPTEKQAGHSPSPAALSAAEDLIFYAIRKGHLSPWYIQPLLLKEEMCLAYQQPAMPRKACPSIIPRSEWEARETHCPQMSLPAKYVIIIHTAGTTCNTSADCQTRIRDIQSYHMDRLDFCDIGYHFLVGQDGGVYEGVGWNIQGSHTYGYNDIALGIAFIGNFVEKPPNAAALEAAQSLIQCAVDQGHLAPNYLLVGHSDVSQILSPGKALYNIISTWPHFKQ